MRKPLMACVALMLAAGLAAQTPQGGRSSRRESSDAVFAELRQQWARNLHDKRIDVSVGEYATDAEFIQPDGTRVRGSDALRKLFETITTTFDSDLVFESQRVETSGKLAYDSGTYHETLVLRASEKHQSSTGSYLTIYRREPNGVWLIVEQAWTGTVQ
jgi:ketosteroid isomerase-like protein